ncbi:MAG TPA: DUF6174 domain-containing protein [Isosphaeraceae bacterium]|nr:DUF6174 domain-containing protein [Isosphaeraceae bacterium]
MPIATRRTRIIRTAVLSLLPILAGCAGGEEVTVQSIGQARRLWDRAQIRDYDLEWTSSGLNHGHYRVAVRGGQVRSIESIQPDGRGVTVDPAEPRYYGVEGLFTTIKDELAQLQMPEPFGQAKGNKVMMRFTPDPKLGFPRRYRRDVLGTPQALAIDVIRFVPDPRARSAPSS